MTIMTLWQPILGSALLVFLAGGAIWMFMPWHKTDWSKTSDEEGVRNALRGQAPGQYTVPYAIEQKDLANPEILRQFKEGPVGFITIIPSGEPAMGGKLAMMFGYNVLVGVVCAYFVSRTLAPNAEYLAIFRISGAVAFTAYGMAYVQDSVWFGRPWSTTLKTFFDALIYAALTGGVFGWLV